MDLSLLENFSWVIPNGGDLSNIISLDNDLPLSNDPARLRELTQSIINEPFKLYFFDEHGNETAILYPAGLSALHVLGAINTYYQSPIENIPNVREDYYPSVAEKRRNGQPIVRADLMLDHQYYEGLMRYKDGYMVSLGS